MEILTASDKSVAQCLFLVDVTIMMLCHDMTRSVLSGFPSFLLAIGEAEVPDQLRSSTEYKALGNFWRFQADLLRI